MSHPIYVTKPYLPPKEEYEKYLDQIWSSNILTNMGSLHNQLEQRLQEILEVPYAMLFTNGHLALETLLQALDLHGEVITTPFTFVSTCHAIVRNGLTPVFCDIRKEDYTIDPEKIEACITEKTTAIVGVHVYGNPCDIEAINRIAKKYNLKVIYDAAHAFGEKVSGIGIGNFGDGSIFSFHATKVFHSVEGGAVVIKDLDMGYKMHQLRNFGITGEEKISGIGLNAKMSEFHAAMGLCNLNHLQELIQKRKERVLYYEKLLGQIPEVILSKRREEVEYNYAYMPIVFEDSESGQIRYRVCNALNKEKIYPRKYFYPLLSQCGCYEGKFEIQETPIALQISDNVLCLPLYPDLAFEEIEKICHIIANCI
ncbi:dTDP-4-amino-4,6-dideoxy-D-glucose transaminase [Clostridiales bacterium CHKCI001]|nr:dTDP-4-amino-4,6-dideoxy-D-glucose transaminase [Clostridiales bacterium CHKCI001]